MAVTRAYLDYNASAPLLAAARAAVVDALDIAANPSSVHTEGRAARRVIEEARRSVAALVGARPEHVVFTSGATEAASTLLTPDWKMGRGAVRMSRLFVSEADHPCILGGGRFPPAQVSRIGVDGAGIVDVEALAGALAAHDKTEGLPLVAIHGANNETGVIQPIGRIAGIVKQAGGVLVVDAVQAAGRIPIDISAGYADYLILSSHKIGGPKGVGALIARNSATIPLALIRGGGQERSRRAGTENVAGIAGFGAAVAAAKAAAPVEVPRMLQLRRLLEDGLKATAGAVIFADNAERLPNTTLVGLAGMRAETAVIGLDLAGVAVSSGAACSSGKVSASHVLAAMGVPGPLAEGAVRLSLGWSTTESEIQAALEAWRKLASVLGRRG